MKTTINGITIDPEPIGMGMYDIICQMNKEALVAFGMLPAPLMTRITELMRERIILEARRVAPKGPLGPTGIDTKVLDETVREMTKLICSAIFKAASDAKMMVV